MEKIYMEESKNRKVRKSVFDFSVTVSFVIAICSMLSLVVFGFVSNKSNISYAVPVFQGDSFSLNYGVGDGGARLEIVGKSTSNPDGKFTIYPYYTDSTNVTPAFCLEHNKTFPNADSLVYTRGNEVAGLSGDVGLSYILKHSYCDTSNATTQAATCMVKQGETNTYLENWLTQVAIWVYLSDKYPSDSRFTLAADEINFIKIVDKISVNNSAVGEKTYSNLYTNYILPIVNEAKTVTQESLLNLNMVRKDVTTVGDYFQTPKVIVTGFNQEKYRVSLATSISGAIIVDESGNEVSKDSDGYYYFTPGKNFYVRVPKASVTSVQNLKINVTSYTDLYQAFEYATTDSSLQKLMVVDCKYLYPQKSLNIEFSPSENTGLNKSQTIYFIGLVVLLCGIGIVYANAKAAQAK